jgi:hypothetical protein
MSGRANGTAAVLVRWLARTALLAFWAVVGWGWLLLGLTLISALGEGVRTALLRLLPPRGASAWAWLNASAATLALAVGFVLVGFVLWTVREGPPSAPASSSRSGGGQRPLPPAS